MAIAQLLASLALAWTLAGDPFTYEYNGQTDGNGNAWIIIVNDEDMKDVEVVISGDGKTINKSPGNLKGGSRYKVNWKQSSPQAKYQLDIRARRKSGDVEGAFAFEIVKTTKAAPAASWASSRTGPAAKTSSSATRSSSRRPLASRATSTRSTTATARSRRRAPRTRPTSRPAA